MDIVIIDGQAIGYASHFSRIALMRGDGTPTTVVYGFFQQIKTIVEQTGCANLVFTWDTKESKRREIYPEYKKNRVQQKKEDPTLMDAFFQFEELYSTILPRLGFVNNFRTEGYEADDIIASICKNKEDDDRITIVSNDADLYQLLGNGVRMYKPVKAKFYTAKSFQLEFLGLCPCNWVHVKAMAGCPGDNVKGIPRVGIRTAVKYLMDDSGQPHKKLDTYDAHQIVARNWPLVRLPFEGTPKYEIKDVKMDYQVFKEFCEEYEFKRFLTTHGTFWKDLFNGIAPIGFFAAPAKGKYRR